MLPRPAMLLLGSLPLWGQAPASVPPSLQDSDALLLQLVLGNLPLGDGLTAFPGRDGATLVPLGEICRLLGLGIRINPGGRGASGFFIAEKRRFRLDPARGLVEVEGRLLPLGPGDTQAKGGEIFVAAHLLESWFPVKVKVNVKAATLVLEPTEKLPVQLAQERERIMKGLAAAPSGPGPRLPMVETPYAFLDWPMVDLSTGWSSSQHAATLPPQGSLNLTGDALWMTGQMVFTRDSSARNHLARTTFFREDPDGNLLGPVAARRLMVGDVMQSPVLEMAGAVPPGRGFLLDNYPTAYRSSFAGRSFKGNLAEGWSAELYQNGALVAMVRSRPDGLYEFPNVPMRFGLNIFKLVFHGPQGERREEISRLDIAQDMPPAGTLYYRLASLKPTERVFAEQGDRSSAVAEADYGLTNTWSMKGAFSQVSRPEGAHAYSIMGLRGILPFLATEFYAGRDRPPLGGPTGSATQLVARTGFGYSTLSASRSNYSNGFLKTSGTGSGGTMGLLRGETTVDLFQAFTVHSLPCGITFGRNLQDLVGSGRLTRDSLQLSANLPRANVTQTFYRVKNANQGDAPVPLESNLVVSSFSEVTTRQGELGFVLSEGKTKLKNWGGGQDYRSPDGTLYRLYLRGMDSMLRNAVLTASANKMLGRISYGVDLQVSRSAGYSVGLRLGTSLGREPRSGRWTADAQSLGNQGGVSAQAYLDANGDNRRQPREKVLEDVRFRIGSTALENRSKDPATAFYLNTARAQVQDIRLDATTLEDPSQMPGKPGLNFVPRPGKVARIDFPVVVLGEITSTTRLQRDGKVQSYGGVEVELLDAGGQRIKLLRSSYDGFFEIRDLPLGEYTLQVTAEEAARLNLNQAPSRKLRLDLARPFQDGIDLILVDPASAGKDTPPAAAVPALSPAPASAPGPTPASPPVPAPAPADPPIPLP